MNEVEFGIMEVYDEHEQAIYLDGEQIAYIFPSHREMELLEPKSRTHEWFETVNRLLPDDIRLVKWGKCTYMVDFIDAGYILPFEDGIQLCSLHL